MKRILALGAIVLELGFIVWMCIEAMLSKPGQGNHFMAALVAAVLFPILIYCMFFFARILKGRGVSKEENND